MAYTKAQVKSLQKSINNLKTFRPKCGKLTENSILDSETRSALLEFVNACRHKKLVTFFKDDPQNVVVIADFIIANNPVGNGTLLKNLFLYDHQDIQRIIWWLGIKYYLKPKGCESR